MLKQVNLQTFLQVSKYYIINLLEFSIKLIFIISYPKLILHSLNFIFSNKLSKTLLFLQIRLYLQL